MRKPLGFAISLLVLSACGLEDAKVEITTTNNNSQTESDNNSSSGNNSDSGNSQDGQSANNQPDDSTASVLVLQENESGFCSLDGEVQTEHTGFTSTGYANTENKQGVQIRWAVNAENAGNYTANIRFADGGDVARPGNLIVNGVAASVFDAVTTGEWTTYEMSGDISLTLQAGINKIILEATTGGGLPNIDSVRLNATDVIAADCAVYDDSGSGSDQDTDNSNDNGDTNAGDSSDNNGDTGTGGNDNDSGADGSDNGTNNSDSSNGGDDSTAGGEVVYPNASCEALVNDDTINWRESSLQTDQEIVECLSTTLGKPIGFGEKTTGGYNAQGGSNLVVITKEGSKTVEEQLYAAISSDDYNWIVFDKKDFADESEVAMYRLFCADSDVLSALDNATEAECREPTLWCENHGVSSDACLSEFFNNRLNNKELPIRNRMVDSNTTIDGRGSNAFMLFNGFAIGGDSKGKSTHVSENIVITNMEFRGAGHSEDHGLDPDMIRSTGESNNIWIHKNTFDTTGDSAWDIKVGAHNITISFNKLINVKRAGLMGSSDSRVINEQITTTMHNNLFVTTDENYADKQFDTLRRVPLMRRGQAHMFNNVFYGYRKDILSVRKGGRILFEDNMILNNAEEAANHKNSDDIEYFVEGLLRDFREGGLEVRDSLVWMSDDNCQLQGEPGDLTNSEGSTPEMAEAYSAASRTAMQNNLIPVGQNLADYLFATTGKNGVASYLSPLAQDVNTVIANAPTTCQQASKVH